MTTEKTVTIEWRLLNVMAERNIRSGAQLRRLLDNMGITISSQQINRLINRLPQKLNTRYLVGLLSVLECDVSDLMRVKRS